MKPAGSLEKCQKGLFAPIGAFLSCDGLRVMVCNWKWDREEWASVCTLMFFFFFSLVAIVPFTSYTFIEAAAEQQQLHSKEREDRGDVLSDYGNVLSIA